MLCVVMLLMSELVSFVMPKICTLCAPKDPRVCMAVLNEAHTLLCALECDLLER